MPRPRARACLQDGLKLDLNRLSQTIREIPENLARVFPEPTAGARTRFQSSVRADAWMLTLV